MSAVFSIQAAAERSGLTPHVIRAWERRYRAIEPERSPGRQRVYSEAEVERLALLSRAVRSGHSIGRIATLPLEQLRTLATEAAAPARAAQERSAGRDPARSFREEALRAATRFDGEALGAVLDRALVEHGSQGHIRRVLGPLAQEIGELWRAGDLTVAHEHFFTASARAILSEMIRKAAVPLGAPRIVVATPSGQLHELGALMAAATAANLGWRPTYLGPNLPAYEIAGAARGNDAAAVGFNLNDALLFFLGRFARIAHHDEIGQARRTLALVFPR